MKLLPKNSVIASQKQKERKAEIDEGIKLANSIDEMRRLRAGEEQSFKEYRKNALRAIQEEIAAYLSERDTLLKEVIALRDIRQSLLEPLNVEWKELRQEQQKLEEEKKQWRKQKNVQ